LLVFAHLPDTPLLQCTHEAHRVPAAQINRFSGLQDDYIEKIGSSLYRNQATTHASSAGKSAFGGHKRGYSLNRFGECVKLADAQLPYRIRDLLFGCVDACAGPLTGGRSVSIGYKGLTAVAFTQLVDN
jgi:hypothetical protein